MDDSWRISLRVCPNAEGPKAGKLKIGEKKYVLLLVLHRDDHNYFLNINDYINYISYSQFIYCCRVEILIHLFIPPNIVSVNFTCLLCFLIFRTTSHYTILYYTILYYTILYYTILYYTILYYTILYYTILFYTVLYCTVLYCSIQYYTILYYTVLYHTIVKYSIVFFITLFKFNFLFC